MRPDILHLSASGHAHDAEAALRAGLAALSEEVASDRSVLLQSVETGTGVLARSALARELIDDAAGVAAVVGRPVHPAAALEAAVADAAVAEAHLQGNLQALAIGVNPAIAYLLAAEHAFPESAGAADDLSAELLRALEAPIALKGETGGVAVLAGEGGAVGVLARSAALALLCAEALAAHQAPARARPDGPGKETGEDGDETWDALSGTARIASALKAAGLLRGVALSLRGRGRIIGPIDGDRLLRFGVSHWR